MRLNHNPSLVNGRRLNGIVTVALSDVEVTLCSADNYAWFPTFQVSDVRQFGLLLLGAIGGVFLLVVVISIMLVVVLKRIRGKSSQFTLIIPHTAIQLTIKAH